MRDDGLIRIIAVVAAASGVLAAVTGHGGVAAVAGICAVVVAGIAVRSRDAVDPGPAASSGAIDLREEQASVVPVVQSPVAESSADEPPVAGEFTSETSAQLLDLDHLASALRGRIAIARRALRPLSIVHIMILGADEGSGPVAAELMAAAARATLRESDIVGRRDDGVYVVVLEDTGEDGAVWTTERLRRHIAGTIEPRRFHAGVASYPSHGLDAESVEANAMKALRAAQEWDRDRIEVAVH